MTSSRQILSQALLARGYSRVGKTKLTLMNLHLPWHFRISEGHKNSKPFGRDVWITDRGSLRAGPAFAIATPVPRASRAILLAEGLAHPGAITLRELGL